MAAMTGEPRYPFVEVHVGADEAEEAGALLFELGALGVEQRDASTLEPANPGIAVLIASFEAREDAQTAIVSVPSGWSPRLGEVVGDGWRDEWKKHFEPFELCSGILVRPPWRSLEQRSGQSAIVLEPGRAFGTGLHETTALVAQAMSKRRADVRGRSVLDVGCGSGILSLVALELGARAVRAVDIDPEAVAVTRENAARNGVEERLRVDDTPVAALQDAFDVVLANIEAAPLVRLAGDISARLAPHGWLVLSGILEPGVDTAQWPSVRHAYPALRVEEICTQGQWLAAVLRP